MRQNLITLKSNYLFSFLLITLTFILGIVIIHHYSTNIAYGLEEYSIVKKFGSQGAADGEFVKIADIAFDSSGNLYALDSANNRVQKFSADGTYITEWSFSSDLGPVNSLPGITIDPTGNVFIVDSKGHRIEKHSIDGGYLNSFGKNGIGDGQFSYPNGISVDNSGNLYVIDSGNHRIQKFTNDGEYITKWGSQGSGDGQFLKPVAIAVDPISGNIYVADSGNNRIQIFSINTE